MNIIQEYNQTKIVEYFGNMLKVPAATRWLATDKDGEVYAYMEGQVPYETKHDNWFGTDYVSVALAEEGTFNWKESLVEV